MEFVIIYDSNEGSEELQVGDVIFDVEHDNIIIRAHKKDPEKPVRPLKEIVKELEGNGVYVSLLHCYDCMDASLGELELYPYLEDKHKEALARVLHELWLKDETNTSISKLADDLAELIKEKGLDYVLDARPRDLLVEVI